MHIDETHTLQAVLGGAVSTNEPTGEASWIDYANGPDQGGENALIGSADFTLNGATAVTIVPSPPKGWKRVIQGIHLYNADTAGITVTIERTLTSASTSVVILKGTRATLENLTYERGYGWKAQSVALAAQ